MSDKWRENKIVSESSLVEWRKCIRYLIMPHQCSFQVFNSWTIEAVERTRDKLMPHLYVRHISDAFGGARAGGWARERHSSSEVAFASPFLLYLLCSHRWQGALRGAEVTEAGMRGDIFHRAPARLQLLFQRKFANGSPLSPLVRCFRAGFHILCDNFFLPDTYGRQRTATRVTIFTPQAGAAG